MLIQVVPRVVPVMLVVGVMACLSTSQQVMTNDQCYVVSVSGGVTRYDSQWWTWQLSPGVKSQSTGCRMATEVLVQYLGANRNIKRIF